MVFSCTRHMHGPESSVSCHVTQESALGVCASHDDALSWMRLYIDPVCLTEFIILTGDKGLYYLDFRLSDTVHLADLKYPVSEQLLGSSLIPHIRNG